jgi:hypothetical protein
MGANVWSRQLRFREGGDVGHVEMSVPRPGGSEFSGGGIARGFLIFPRLVVCAGESATQGMLGGAIAALLDGARRGWEALW